MNREEFIEETARIKNEGNKKINSELKKINKEFIVNFEKRFFKNENNLIVLSYANKSTDFASCYVDTTAANTILDNGPAAKTEYFTASDFLLSCFSSGSTNAPISGPRKNIPDDFILIL